MPVELSILMPVYNERDRIEAALETTLATFLPFETELVVVDDGSTDGTWEILETYDWPPNARLLRHEHNRGKGAAVRTALAHAEGTFSSVLDADLEYDPSDLEALLVPLRRGDSNAAFGVRVFDGYSSHSFLFVMGNKLVTLLANVLFNVYLHDLMTCHKAIRTTVFRELALRSNGFTIEPEIAARLVQRGERIFEVPVSYLARSSADGKKLTSKDGLRVVGTLIRCRLAGARRQPQPHTSAPPALLSLGGEGQSPDQPAPAEAEALRVAARPAP